MSHPLFSENKLRLETLLLLLVAVVSSWFCYRMQSFISVSHIPTQIEHHVDAFMENVEVTEFSEIGQVQNALVAKQVLQYSYPDQQVLVLREPHLNLTSNNQHHWQVTAGSGVTSMRDSSAHIRLEEGVRAKEQDSSGRLLTTIATPELELDPRTRVGKTDKPIQIEQNMGKVFATGMHANFKTGIITLLSDVRGLYEV